MIDPIPYIHPDAIGPFKPFGLLVAAGILAGSWFAQRRARQAKVDLDEVRSAVAWAVVVGFIGAHLVAIVYYKPERVADEGVVSLLKIWDGISSYGGFLGALVGLVIYYGRRSRPKPIQAALLVAPLLTAALTGVSHLLGQILFGASVVAVLWYYWKPDKPWSGIAEIIVQALVVGWIFGRAGCFVAFDHPGAITDFPLGEVYGIGGEVRHNLGLYEMLYTALVLTPVMLLMHRRNPPMGKIMAWMAILYAPIRFVLDALRAQDLASADARFLGLTPAQYFSLAALAFGIYWLLRVKRAQQRDPSYPHVFDLSAAMGSGTPRKRAATLPDTPRARLSEGATRKKHRS
jgi:phosphatidylglycerol---prolipoprotein diacylglyceryl transferase